MRRSCSLYLPHGRGVNSSAMQGTARRFTAVRCRAASDCAYGRAPYVKQQFHLLTHKCDAAAIAVCSMAELEKRLWNGGFLCIMGNCHAGHEM